MTSQILTLPERDMLERQQEAPAKQIKSGDMVYWHGALHRVLSVEHKPVAKIECVTYPGIAQEIPIAQLEKAA